MLSSNVEKKIRFEDMVIFLLALSVFPHSILKWSINVSISDIYLLIMVFFLLITKKGKIKIFKKYSILISIYLFICVVSFFISTNLKSSLIRLIQYTQYLVLTVLVFSNINSKGILKKTIYLYLIPSTVLSIIAILITIKDGYNGAIYILGYQKNALGAVVGYAIPLILGLYQFNKYKILLSLSLILNGIALFLTFSRGAILGSFIASFLILLFTKKIKKIFYFIINILILTSTLLVLLPDWIINQFFDFQQNSSAYSRIIIYEDAVQKIKQNLLIGNGIGNYFIRIPSINFSQDDPSNVFLLNLVEIGIIGLIVFILILIYIYIKAIKNVKLFKYDKDLLILNSIFISCFTARIIHVQVDVMWVRGVSLFTFAMVGMLLSLGCINKNSN